MDQTPKCKRTPFNHSQSHRAPARGDSCLQRSRRTDQHAIRVMSLSLVHPSGGARAHPTRRYGWLLAVAPSHTYTHTHTHTPSHFSGSTPSTTRASHPSTSIVTTRWVGAVSCRAPGSTVTVRRCAKRLRVLATAFRRLLPLRKNLRRRHSALIACT